MKRVCLLAVLLVSAPAWAQNPVTIHVVDSRHRPVAGAAVEARPRREEVAPQSGETNARGDVTFNFPSQAGEVFPVEGAVVVPGFAFTSFTVSGPKMEVQLDRGSVWRGKVTDEAGNPISGAKVEVNGAVLDPESYLRVNLLGTQFAPQFTTSTAADGTFEMSGVPAEGLEYRISAPKYAEFQGFAKKSDTPAQIHLVKGAVLRGRLLGVDGQGLPHVRVVALAELGFGSDETATDGSFVLDTLLPGIYDVDFQVGPKVDFVIPGLVKVRVQKEEIMPPVELRAIPGVLVTGQVLDPAGNPVAGVKIGVTGPLSPYNPVEVTTGNDGHFSVRCLPGINNFGISGAPKGYQHLFFSHPVTVTDQSLPPLNFTLNKAVPLHGRVVDESGKPLQAVIQVRFDRFISSGKDGQWELDSSEVNPVSRDADIAGGDGEDGYFEVISPVRLDISKSAPSTIVARKKKWTVLKGRTLDTNGKPLAGVRVSVSLVPYDLEQAGRDEVFELGRRAVSDANGYFTLQQMRHSDDSTLLKVKAFKTGYVLNSGCETFKDHGKWGLADFVMVPVKP